MIASGTYDGEMKLWDVAEQRSILTHSEAHQGQVTGVSLWNEHVLSTGRDGFVRLWDFSSPEPLGVFNAHASQAGLDHMWGNDSNFVTCGGDGALVWDYARSHPVETLKWESFDNLLAIRANPSETTLLAAASSDCSVMLYDTRGSVPLRKTRLTLKSNSLAWNPREPMILTTASDDGNLYTFDIRNFTAALRVHKDHTNSVLGVSYSPIGREFVSGGIDRTVRLFDFRGGRSRDVYHSRRMHNVLAVEFSGDGKFVVSGSDDANLRIWKAKASEPLKTLLPRER